MPDMSSDSLTPQELALVESTRATYGEDCAKVQEKALFKAKNCYKQFNLGGVIVGVVGLIAASYVASKLLDWLAD